MVSQLTYDDRLSVTALYLCVYVCVWLRICVYVCVCVRVSVPASENMLNKRTEKRDATEECGLPRTIEQHEY